MIKFFLILLLKNYSGTLALISKPIIKKIVGLIIQGVIVTSLEKWVSERILQKY